VHTPPFAHDNAIVVVVVVVVVVAVDVVVDVDGIGDVIVDGIVAAVAVDTTVDVVATADVVAHGSLTEGANAKPPSNTSGATIADIRPAEARTQRVTTTPAMNKNRPATTTNVEPPVAGRLQTSTLNIAKTPSIQDQGEKLADLQ
jgi:hypothetical protein